MGKDTLTRESEEGSNLERFHNGSEREAMRTRTLTLKNVPVTLHTRLKESAERNRRSLNSEVLMRLESAMAAPVVDRASHARALKEFVAALPKVDATKIDRYKRQGRA